MQAWGGIRLLANSCQARLADWVGGLSWPSTGSSPTVPERVIEWERTLSTAGSRTIGVGHSQLGAGLASLGCGWRRRKEGKKTRQRDRREIRQPVRVIVWYGTIQYGKGTCEKRRGERNQGTSGRVKLDCRRKSPSPQARMQWRADGAGQKWTRWTGLNRQGGPLTS